MPPFYVTTPELVRLLLYCEYNIGIKAFSTSCYSVVSVHRALIVARLLQTLIYNCLMPYYVYEQYKANCIYECARIVYSIYMFSPHETQETYLPSAGQEQGANSLCRVSPKPTSFHF